MNFGTFFDVNLGLSSYAQLTCALLALGFSAHLCASRSKWWTERRAGAGIALGIAAFGLGWWVRAMLAYTMVNVRASAPDPRVIRFYEAGLERSNDVVTVLQVLGLAAALAASVCVVARAPRPFKLGGRILIGVGLCVVGAVLCWVASFVFHAASVASWSAAVPQLPLEQRAAFLEAIPALSGKDALKLLMPGFLLLALGGALVPFAVVRPSTQT